MQQCSNNSNILLNCTESSSYGLCMLAAKPYCCIPFDYVQINRHDYSSNYAKSMTATYLRLKSRIQFTEYLFLLFWRNGEIHLLNCSERVVTVQNLWLCNIIPFEKYKTIQRILVFTSEKSCNYAKSMAVQHISFWKVERNSLKAETLELLQGPARDPSIHQPNVWSWFWIFKIISHLW